MSIILPELSFDLDGVIAGFHQRLIDIYNDGSDAQAKPYRIPEAARLTLLDIDCELENLGPELLSPLVKIFNAPGFLVNLDPIPGAIEIVSQYKDHDVVICTAPARDIGGIPNEVSFMEKCAWVKKWLPFWTRHLIPAERKERVHSHVLVDDTPKNIQKWCAKHPDGIGLLVDQPWNRKFKDYPRNSVRADLADLPELLQKFWCYEQGKFLYRPTELRQWQV